MDMILSRKFVYILRYTRYTQKFIASNRFENLFLQKYESTTNTFTVTLLFLFSSVNEKVALSILSAMIPMGEVLLSKEKDTSAFPELMSVMQTLAGAGQGVGHKSLFPAATEWLEIW